MFISLILLKCIFQSFKGNNGYGLTISHSYTFNNYFLISVLAKRCRTRFQYCIADRFDKHEQVYKITAYNITTSKCTKHEKSFGYRFRYLLDYAFFNVCLSWKQSIIYLQILNVLYSYTRVARYVMCKSIQLKW